jgi:tetratricopeptide (TPR) repeat protein
MWSQKQLADTVRLKAIDEMTEGIVRNKPDSGYALAQRMLDLALISGNKKYQAAAYFLEGRAYSYMPDFPKSLNSYQKSITLYSEIGDLKSKAKTMAYISGLYDYQREYEKAIDIAIQVLAIAHRIGDLERSAGVSKVLGHSYLKIGAYERAIDVFKNGLRDAEKVNDKISMAYFLNSIGDLYVEQREEAKALDYLNRSLQVGEEANDQMSIAGVYLVKGKNELYENNFFDAIEYLNKSLDIYEYIESQSSIGQTLYLIGRVHKEKEKFELALDYLDRAKKIAIETSFQAYYTDLLIQEGNIKLTQGMPSEAIQLCHETYKIAQTSNMIKEEHDACDCLYNAYKQQNNINEALLYHEKMTILTKRIELESTAKNLQNFEYFRTKLKDSIAAVERKRVEEARVSQVKAETKRRHGLQYTGILLVVILLFIIVFLSGKITIQPRVVKGLVVFTFLIFFEFILVLVSPAIGSFTNGEPAFMLLCNALLAILILPIHSFFEKMVKKKVSKA